ncbi:MAG: tetratricopeptide repeat protein, partial [Armatimonadetes bacterium]|nr:tetratricopeptide repeat protein [Armatimonadota bacterium]
GMTIEVDGTLWVPVEITLIGKAGFFEAWRRGVEEWAQYDAAPAKRGFFTTRKARELYRPVGLKEADLGLHYGRKEAIVAGFRGDKDKVFDALVHESAATAQSSGRKEDYNRLGLASAQLQRYQDAELAFRKALSINPGYMSALINRGNVLFLRQQYTEALQTYQNARSRLESKQKPDSSIMAKLLINVSRTYSQLGKPAEAKDSLARASTFDAAETEKYGGLAERGTGEVRAAESTDPRMDIVFLED